MVVTEMKQPQKKNKLMGFLAEVAVLFSLRSLLGSLVHQKEKQDMSNQVDIFIGTKTVEVRSSQCPKGIDVALFGKRTNGDSIYHLVGDYTTSYKKQEILKDYYIWVVFEDNLSYCYIVGGATKEMIKSAPRISMVPKGTECENPTQYHALRPDEILQFNKLVSTLAPSTNERLSLAKQNKEDEFYTTYATIDNELSHYYELLKDKVVYCPCDDPSFSMFWLYFKMNFKKIGLKKLYASYLSEEPKVFMYDGTDVTSQSIEGNGSYDSAPCKDILRLSDIVITNPPFSLFRDFIKLLTTEQKDFLIIGNQNASTTKDVFPLFQQNKVRYGINMGSEKFRIPNDYETRSKNVQIDEEGNRFITVEGIRWFTTLPVNSERTLRMTKMFNPFVYGKYDNFKAYEVPLVRDIPKNYMGLMGVPISYLNVHDPTVFELIGTSGELAGPIIIDNKLKQRPGRFYIKGNRLYERIVIRRKL